MGGRGEQPCPRPPSSSDRAPREGPTAAPEGEVTVSTVRKEFVPYNVVRNNALKMAFRIHQEGFVPDVIYVSLRGGAYIGNVISEYFKIVRKDSRPIFYALVAAALSQSASFRHGSSHDRPGRTTHIFRGLPFSEGAGTKVIGSTVMRPLLLCEPSN